ncbi:MAG: hypothetical protein ACFFA5_10385 [Promethearchaeota archaeon]
MFHVYKHFSTFKYMFWDRDTWSQGIPLGEMETVNDPKDDEQYTGKARL